MGRGEKGIGGGYYLNYIKRYYVSAPSAKDPLGGERCWFSKSGTPKRFPPNSPLRTTRLHPPVGGPCPSSRAHDDSTGPVNHNGSGGIQGGRRGFYVIVGVLTLVSCRSVVLVSEVNRKHDKKHLLPLRGLDGC